MGSRKFISSTTKKTLEVIRFLRGDIWRIREQDLPRREVADHAVGPVAHAGLEERKPVGAQVQLLAVIDGDDLDFVAVALPGDPGHLASNPAKTIDSYSDFHRFPSSR